LCWICTVLTVHCHSNLYLNIWQHQDAFFWFGSKQVFVITSYYDVSDGESSNTNVIIFVVLMYKFVSINHVVCRPWHSDTHTSVIWPGIVCIDISGTWIQPRYLLGLVYRYIWHLNSPRYLVGFVYRYIWHLNSPPVFSGVRV
jgi:hypothetical protein